MKIKVIIYMNIEILILQALLQLKQQNKDIDPHNIMIGNGLMNYDFNAGNGNPVFEDYRHLVDGFCMEHTMGFEVLSDSNLMAIETKTLLSGHISQCRGGPLYQPGGTGESD